MSKPKLYYIEWCDAISNEDGTWISKKDAIKWGKDINWVVRQTGWILKETKRYIILADKIADHNFQEYRKFGGVFKIPKTWVLKKKRIKV